MKNIFAGVSMLVLAGALTVGCGGTQESQEETQTPSSSQTTDSANPPPSSEASSPWTNGETESGKVGAAAACCYVKCSKWHGPFRDVQYNNCTNFGRYWCGQQGGGDYSADKWDNC